MATDRIRRDRPGTQFLNVAQWGRRHHCPYWTPFMREDDDEEVLAAFREQRGFLR